MNRLVRTLIAVLTISATLGALLVSSSATLAGNVRPPTFLVGLDGCIAGKLPQDNTAVDVVWRDKNGHRKARFHYQTSDGYWYAPDSVCATYTAVKGDTIRAHITQPIDITRTFTVKNITATFNRITNVIAGTAPAAGMFSLEIGRPDLATNSFMSICDHPTPVDGQGHYAYDTSSCVTGYDAIGGDEAVATWFSPAGDRVVRSMHAPYLEANQGSAKVDGYMDPAGSIALTLRSGSGATLGSAHAAADQFGQYHATFRKSGQPVRIRPNDTISGNWPGQGYKVRALTIQWDLVADTVQGTCTPYTAFGILLKASDGSAHLDDTTDATGATGVLDLSTSTHQLGAGDRITLVCMRPNGDRTKLVEVIPA